MKIGIIITIAILLVLAGAAIITPSSPNRASSHSPPIKVISRPGA